MKKIVLLSVLAFAVAFQYCSSSKKAHTDAAKTTYAANVQPLIQANCSPCHIPPQGRAKPLNTYDAAKSSADEMVVRMRRNPDERGFMPMRHPKLADSTIAVFDRWKAGGFAE